MKLFQTVQSHLASLGYNTNRNSFNLDTLGYILQLILALACQFIYFIRVDNTKNAMDTVFMIAVTISVFISFIGTVQKMPIIFMFTSETEKVINGSEFRLR